MKVKQEQATLIRQMLVEKGEGTVVAKDIFLIPTVGPKLLDIFRAFAERPSFGKFVLNEEMVAKVEASVGVIAPKAVAVPKVPKAPKVAKVKGAVDATDGGKREATQLAQLAKQARDAEIGEVMYEKDLMALGAVKIDQAAARDLVMQGVAVYAIDRNFSSGLVVPPLALDLTLAKTATEFYRLPITE